MRSESYVDETTPSPLVVVYNIMFECAIYLFFYMMILQYNEESVLAYTCDFSPFQDFLCDFNKSCS